MARIDLKNATLKLKDGYSGPGGTPLINNTIANPSVDPTVDPDGGGSMGGSLAAADYVLSYTFLTATGETLRSNSTMAFTVAAGEIPEVTLPTLPAGVTGINVYLSQQDGNSASERLYNDTPITTTMYNLEDAHDWDNADTPPVANTAGGYATGVTTITVDGFTGAVANLDNFTIDGETGSPSHSVSSHVETGSNTTQITFTPALASNIADNAALTILPHELEVKIGEGNLTYEERKNIEYLKDRGLLDTAREGDQEVIEVRMDFVWESLKASSGDPPSIEDALKKRGQAANWVSSSDDPCEPYAVDIEIYHTPPCSGEDIEQVILPDFRYTSLSHDFRAGSVAATGQSHATEAIINRIAA